MDNYLQDNDRLILLLDAYVQGRINTDEELELIDLIIELQDEDAMRVYVEGIWDQQGEDPAIHSHVDWDAMFSSIIEEEKKTAVVIAPSYFKKYGVIAAAVMALILLSVGGYFLFQNDNHAPLDISKSPVKQDVLPPLGNKATITLSDGSVLSLDTLNNGLLAVDGSMKIQKLADGKLEYKPMAHAGVAEVYNTIQNPRGSKVIGMQLSDGSKVWLNVGSSIRFPVSFTGNERKVFMSGEGYFEVAHNSAKPFKVQKGDLIVKVLGTHFNMKAYDDEKSEEVTLLEGEVQVNTESENKRLRPGQQAKVGEEIQVIDDVDVDMTMAWKNGLFTFQATPMHEMMMQIARWYDVEVRYEGNVPNKKFGGKIHRDASLSQVLGILEESGIRYRINGKILTITQ